MAIYEGKSKDDEFGVLNPLHNDDEIVDIGELIDYSKETLPEMGNWKVLVERYRMPEKTKGGIILTADTVDMGQRNNFIGRIISIGPAAFTSERFQGPDGRYTEYAVGDWVILSTFSGFALEYRLSTGKAVKWHIHNDIDIMAKIPTPIGYKVLGVG